MSSKFSAPQVAVALKKAHGFYDIAARLLKTDRATIHKYILKFPELQKLVDQLIEANLDLAENKLLDKIKGGDTTAILFYLRTKGKKRGYMEKQEFEDAKPVHINIVPVGQAVKENDRGKSKIAAALKKHEQEIEDFHTGETGKILPLKRETLNVTN